MQILYITTLALESNNPANMANIALINGLVSLGHKVDTLSMGIDENSKTFDPTINLDIISKDYRLPISKSHKYLSSKTTENKERYSIKIKNSIKRLVKNIYMKVGLYDELKYSIISMDEIELPMKSYDAIISASDPLSSHLLAERYLKKYNTNSIKWIQYWQDPMYMDITRKHIFPILLKREENRLLAKAYKVVYVSPLTKKTNEEIYFTNADKMFFIPPGYFKKRVIKLKKINKKPLLGYYGSYSSVARNIMPLYDAAGNGKFKLEIIGHGDYKLEDNSNVTITERIPIGEIEKKELLADILVCICNHNGTQIPSKIYYYTATNKPILIILDGEAQFIKDFLQPFNRYVFCKNNPTDINRAVKNIIDGKTNTQDDPVDEFSGRAIADKFIKLIED